MKSVQTYDTQWEWVRREGQNVFLPGIGRKWNKHNCWLTYISVLFSSKTDWEIQKNLLHEG